MRLTAAQITEFREQLSRHYEQHGRHTLPWRQLQPNGTADPYKILVSELMLQQTQVPRVITKYHEFLGRFPTLGTLARAGQGEVLTAWSGLGYNRRAKYLHQSAKTIAAAGGVFPKTITELVKLPGVGKNTAGAILAYAFNLPTIFVETNIRTVYIHHFFAGHTDVLDKAIMELLEQTLDTSNSRQFYWSLMDYGAHIKRSNGNLNKLSKHYTKQSAFVGSRRQIRGQVLKLLAAGPATNKMLEHAISDSRLQPVLQELVAEQMIHVRGGTYRL